MPELRLSEIFVYPIKSVTGISLNEAAVELRGLKLDRRWMLVDAEGKFLSQRTLPELSLISASIENDGLLVTHKTKNFGELFIPFEVDEEYSGEAVIWEDKCSAVFVSNSADCWFSKVLGFPCRLVYMPDSSRRTVDAKYSSGKEIVGFADAFPFLLIGRSSLDDLNSKLIDPVPVNRFRPNLVFTGGEPFVEDCWKEFNIGTVKFYKAKPCARCVVTTIDQATGIKGTEPLNRLSTYRKFGSKVLFGQNLTHSGTGIIKINDPLTVIL